MRTTLLLISAGLLAYPQDKANLYVVHQIKQEALENSKVMDHLFRLTDVNGHRLTNSPGFDKAANWVKKSLNEFGVSEVSFEKWGPFGRGWTYSNFSAHLVEPAYSPLIGYPNAWTGGTRGPVQAEVMMAPIRVEADMEKWKGKLKGKMIVMEPERSIGLHTIARGRRYADSDLAAEATAPDPAATGVFGLTAGPGRRGAPTGPDGRPLTRAAAQAFRAKPHQFLLDEGVVALLMPGYRGEAGTVFAGSGSSQDAKAPIPPPIVSLTIEHYNRIARLIAKKVAVKVRLDVRTEFLDKGADTYNVIAEIKGTKRPEEVVMVGAHLDSWHGATGATDNAAGCAVAIEALRIIKALNLKTDRTIRIALWSGEEQGLFGSKAYVKDHFGDLTNMQLKPEHAKLQAYFNLDNGATTLTIRNTGSTDHVSFNSLGLPGFQFIQDPLEYFSTAHHSNTDVYDYVPKSGLMQASAILASFVYHAATRDEMLAGKPLPKAQPERRGEGGQRATTGPTNN